MVDGDNEAFAHGEALEDATERLVEQVSALSAALQAIGEIQAQQVELQRQVRAVREDVQENAVPKHEFNEAQRVTVAARQRLQTRIRIFAIGVSILALIGSGVSGYVSYRLAQDQRTALCQERNKENIANAAKTKTYFAPYIEQEKHNPKADPVFLQLLIAITQTPPQLIKCN